jgi:hypothetical protein
MPNTRTPRRQGYKLTAKLRRAAQEAFLEAFGKTGIIRAGLDAANVDRASVDWWNEHDEDFNNRYGQMRREADDAIRAEVFRRAVTGVRRRKTISRRDDNGKLVIDRVETVTEYSDAMLALLAKSRIAEFRHGEVVRVEFDDEAMREVIDVLTRVGIDGDTFTRIRAEFAALAMGGSSSSSA